MDLIRKSDTWRVEHSHSKVLAGLRIVLGLLLIYKGIYFAYNTGEIQSMLATSNFGFGTVAMAHYIVMIHFAGGVMIATGFLTRVAILFQLPILIGAILFVNAERGVFSVYSEFLLSVVVLLMLLFFLYYGSGMYALETYLKRKKFYE
jgi:putative oxidoreductase